MAAEMYCGQGGGHHPSPFSVLMGGPMAMEVKEVRWVAHLARLDLAPSEIEAMSVQLGAIIDYVRQLQEVDTTDIEPLAHPLSINNVFRADDAVPSLGVDAALANAPARTGDYFSVPAVLD